MNQLAIGQFAEGEIAVSSLLILSGGRTQDACAGLVLNNMAAILSVSGRITSRSKAGQPESSW
jgi:hypothetical protein